MHSRFLLGIQELKYITVLASCMLGEFEWMINSRMMTPGTISQTISLVFS